MDRDRHREAAAAPRLVDQELAGEGAGGEVVLGPWLLVGDGAGGVARPRGRRHGGRDRPLTVCNQGNSVSSGTNGEVSLSEDGTITPSDPVAGYASVGNLYPGECVELRVQTLAAVPDGAYTLGAVVDSFGDVIELSEANNAASGGDIGVAYAPDLIVSAVSGPPSALPGGSLDVAVTVCNQGTTPSQTPTVEVLLSPDAAIEPSDQLLGGAPIPWLDPGQCGAVTGRRARGQRRDAVPGARPVRCHDDPRERLRTRRRLPPRCDRRSVRMAAGVDRDQQCDAG
ncbi:CARDB domain-containing protein [Sorangium sp. So ce260]|uniref:CARDB domain-containing protein n=1 Tax=Sorangium sp. So ce260 TaxID=3133291 RepID=UPI003F609D9D